MSYNKGPELAFDPPIGVSNHGPQFAAQGDIQVLGGNNIVNYGHVSITSQDDHDTRDLFTHTITDAIHTSETICSQEMCLCGTREPTLGRLAQHLTSTNPNDCDVLWFEGPAGSGKSAVMRSLANTAYDNAALASFFFYRADNRRNTIRGFIPTLAYQMSCAIPSTIPYIAAAIRKNRTILTQNAKLQGRALLEEPLIAAANAFSGASHHAEFPSFVILVDGLDECGEQVKQIEIIEALASFAKVVRERSKIRVKVIVASRPEFAIRHRFKGLKERGISERLTLDPFDAELTLFYEAEFAKIREIYGLPESWPSPSQKEQLLRRASGQYAFAATATKYTASGDPEGRLEMILNATLDDDENPFATLDQLYDLVFKQIPSTMRARALDVIGSILIKDGLSTPNALIIFLNIPENFLQQLSRNYVSSLFRFPDDPTKAISPYHASCADFLFDESRSGKFGLFVSEEKIRNLIAKSVLSTLPSRPRTERDWEVLSDMSPYTKMAGVSNGSFLHPSFLDFDMACLDVWSFILLRPYYSYTLGKPETIGARPPPIQTEIQRRTSEYARHGMHKPFSLFYLYLVALESDPRFPSKTLLKSHLGRICDGQREIDRKAWNLQDTTSWLRALDLRTGAADILFAKSALPTQGEAPLTSAACIRHALHTISQKGSSWEEGILLGAGVYPNSRDRVLKEIRTALLPLTVGRKLHQENLKAPSTAEEEWVNQLLVDLTKSNRLGMTDRTLMSAFPGRQIGPDRPEGVSMEDAGVWQYNPAFERNRNLNQQHVTPSSSASATTSPRHQPQPSPPTPSHHLLSPHDARFNSPSVQKTPPLNWRSRVRHGFWNQRGDHLTLDGHIVYAPAEAAYPEDLSHYPRKDEGYLDHDGMWASYVIRPELPESVPRHGQPAEAPYERFVVWEYKS